MIHRHSQPSRAGPHSTSGFRRRARAHRRPAGTRPVIEYLEARCVMSGLNPITSPAINLPIDPTVQRSGRITTPGGGDVYRFSLDAPGLVTAHVHASGFATLLSLLDANGNTLSQS